jgi:hypothetical protein
MPGEIEQLRAENADLRERLAKTTDELNQARQIALALALAGRQAAAGDTDCAKFFKLLDAKTDNLKILRDD